MSINVTATDDFGVAKVRILVDGVLLTEIYTMPYHATWNSTGQPDGSIHAIRAEALDRARNIGTVQIQVVVQNGRQ